MYCMVMSGFHLKSDETDTTYSVQILSFVGDGKTMGMMAYLMSIPLDFSCK